MDVKLNLRGINRLMTSPGVRRMLRERAEQMAAAAGEGFEAVSRPHPWTAREYVQTADAAGRRRQADEHVLERVVSGGS